MAKKIDLASLKPVVGTMYPPPYHQPCQARATTKLGDAAGLTQFGVSSVRLGPGVWSSQRHWHEREDEFVWVLEGEVVLVTDSGEEILRAGDCAGFKAGVADGHHFQNRSQADAVLLTIGSRDPAERCEYPGLDLVAPPHAQPAMYVHRDGTPYTGLRRRGPGD